MLVCQVCYQEITDNSQICPKDGGQVGPDPLLNTLLDGRYTILSRLGKGGMGIVYLSHDNTANELRAIKFITPILRNNATVIARFEREAEAAQRFSHENAVTIYNCHQGLNLYMVMEYIPGATLRDELRLKKRLTLAEALAVLGPIGNVLDSIHKMGIIHRDIKPDNIMIKNENGKLVPKLLDLGIVKLQDRTALTMINEIIGTPFYMSPEQWLLQSIDGRVDIYSLAIIFYELLTGKLPFQGQTMDEVKDKHLNQLPVPLTNIVPDISLEVSNMILLAMAKNREDRPQTAGELITKLYGVLLNEFKSRPALVQQQANLPLPPMVALPNPAPIDLLPATRTAESESSLPQLDRIAYLKLRVEKNGDIRAFVELAEYYHSRLSTDAQAELKTLLMQLKNLLKDRAKYGESSDTERRMWKLVDEIREYYSQLNITLW